MQAGQALLALLLALLLQSSHALLWTPWKGHGLKRPALRLPRLRSANFLFAAEDNSLSPKADASIASADSDGAPPSIPLLPCGDETDRKILKLLFPALLGFIAAPMTGMVNAYWVGKLRNPAATAAQGAANQIFSSTLWLLAFLPSIITPLIAKAHGAQDLAAAQSRTSEALLMCTVMGLLGTAALLFSPGTALSIVLSRDASGWPTAISYLRIRTLGLLPALLSTIALAVFRGSHDAYTPLRISLLSHVVGMALDPVLIVYGGLGATGAAVSSCLAEFLACALYLHTLYTRRLLDRASLFQLPSWQVVRSLLARGLRVQIRSMALIAVMIAVTRKAQALDHRGVAASAHAIAMQMFQLGSVASLALTTVATVLIPAERGKASTRREQVDDPLLRDLQQRRALRSTRQVANRLFVWSVVLGSVLGGMHVVALPLISVFTPLVEVRKAARLPALLAGGLQALNCVLWVGEGIQQGNERFGALALAAVSATMMTLLSLQWWGNSLGGIWASFAVLAAVRLVGTGYDHLVAGPLAPSRDDKEID